jgi:hypothetical protein
MLGGGDNVIDDAQPERDDVVGDEANHDYQQGVVDDAQPEDNDGGDADAEPDGSGEPPEARGNQLVQAGERTCG